MANSINIKGRLFSPDAPAVMGIVNITPDSFYGESRVQTHSQIIEKVAAMLADGATIIDVGAQSSNSRSPLLTAEEERARLCGILPILRREFPQAVFSIDTFYSDVARMAVEEAGVDIVNDISGGQIDSEMFRTVAELGVPYILMHMRGTPQTMTTLTDYKNLLQEIFLYFSQKIDILHSIGVKDVIIDPGFGFSKTLEQNYELMSHLDKFRILDKPLLVGISRKSMIYRLLEITPEDSLSGTTALNMFALCNGAAILRVHDVREAVHTVQIFQKIKHPLV